MIFPAGGGTLYLFLSQNDVKLIQERSGSPPKSSIAVGSRFFYLQRERKKASFF